MLLEDYIIYLFILFAATGGIPTMELVNFNENINPEPSYNFPMSTIGQRDEKYKRTAEFIKTLKDFLVHRYIL